MMPLLLCSRRPTTCVSFSFMSVPCLYRPGGSYLKAGPSYSLGIAARSTETHCDGSKPYNDRHSVNFEMQSDRKLAD